MKPKKGFMDGYKTYDPGELGFGSSREWRKAFDHRIGKDEAIIIIDYEQMQPWEILGFKYDPWNDYMRPKLAIQADVRRAYFAKIKEWHPDRNASRLEEATEKCKIFNAAYSLLFDGIVTDNLFKRRTKTR